MGQKLDSLMAVERQTFQPVQRPQIEPPPSPALSTIQRAEWSERKCEAKWWHREARRALRMSIAGSVRAHAEEHSQWSVRETARLQALSDKWWADLERGEQGALTTALVTAFADNPAPVRVCHAQAEHAVLVLHLPGIDVLPEKQAHITPAGRLSTKAWTKTERNTVYSQLLGAHLVATVREGLAVGPSLQALRIIGVCESSADPVMFDVAVERSSAWAEADTGMAVLSRARTGLRRTGRTLEVSAWQVGDLAHDVGTLVSQMPAPQSPAPAEHTQGEPPPVYRGSRPPLPPDGWGGRRMGPVPGAIESPTPAVTPWTAPVTEPHGYAYPVPQDRASHGRAPIVTSPVVALLVSVLLPGGGSILAGNRKRGLLLFGGFFLSLLLTVIYIGVVGMIVFWVWGIVAAYQDATAARGGSPAGHRQT